VSASGGGEVSGKRTLGRPTDLESLLASWPVSNRSCRTCAKRQAQTAFGPSVAPLDQGRFHRVTIQLIPSPPSGSSELASSDRSRRSTSLAHSEIAETLIVPMGTVRSRFGRARVVIREQTPRLREAQVTKTEGRSQNG
jgi:hypothetical protein